MAELRASVFTQHYRSVVTCGLAAFDEAAGECRAVCECAWASRGGDCGERYRAVADAVLSWAAENRDAARFLFVVTERTSEPVLLARLSAFKRSVAELFDPSAKYTPAGRIHVEFLVGLFFRVVAEALGGEVSTAALRREVLSLSLFLSGCSTRLAE
ncbi:hypothetical protein SaccyDRAFT_1232 [Saccharomonospora cyanea NA-134]|uniref:Uncharacterized protein n=1 Tax=Saccharomonospora cyanea NA-134 TaxID=882082 RepID=H5XQT2_9PSEU|nr:hypothetical protein SaccyDRAFT_1232 [Saccharomonospora cyanea NA-134]